MIGHFQPIFTLIGWIAISYWSRVETLSLFIWEKYTSKLSILQSFSFNDSWVSKLWIIKLVNRYKSFLLLKYFISSSSEDTLCEIRDLNENWSALAKCILAGGEILRIVDIGVSSSEWPPPKPSRNNINDCSHALVFVDFHRGPPLIEIH